MVEKNTYTIYNINIKKSRMQGKHSYLLKGAVSHYEDIII